MQLLDGMLRMGRFAEYCREMIRMANDDMREQAVWDMWLHKCFDKTYDQFRSDVTGNTNEAIQDAPKKEEIEAAVAQSFDMLASFNPTEV